MIPPEATARKTPFQPNGMNPPPAEKLPVWKAVTTSATIATTGMRIFHQTMPLFDSASHLTPMTLMIENSIMPVATSK